MAQRLEKTAGRMSGRAKKKPASVRDVDAAEVRDEPGLAESVGLVRIVQLQSFQLFYRRFEDTGLSLGALTTLGSIHANPGIRHGVLADALMIKRPNFTKVINRLQRAGYVIREAPKGDKRSTALFVTKKGLRKLAELKSAVVDHHRDLVKVLTPNEREVLLALLRKLSQHLQGLIGTAPISM
jgi:DNA-binding MarR family transcriptional regulator